MNSKKSFEEKFLTDNLQGKRVIVGFSGGADSVSLLYRLVELKKELEIDLNAFHLNHCLRGEESVRDEIFVRDFCKKYSIPLKVKRLDIASLATENGLSEETCGREERYKFFSEEAGENGIIATAHTLSDNLETVVFHMIRGTALKGLCGIPQKRGNIVRPIIDCSREDVEDYCYRKGLEYVNDSTNFSTDYLRNKIRMEIIPKFYEINPSADQSFMRMKNILQKEEEYLETISSDIFEKMKSDEKFLLNPLEGKADIFYSRIAAKLLEYYDFPLDFQNVERISSLLKNKKGRQQMNDEFYLSADGEKLFIESELPKIPFFEKEIDIEDNLKFEVEYFEKFKDKILKKERKLKILVLDKKEDIDFKKVYKNLLIFALDYDTIIGKLSFRQKKEGDKIKVYRRNGTKSLKKLFNEKKINLIDRHKILVVCDNQDIMAIESIGVGERNAITEKTRKVLLILKDE